MSIEFQVGKIIIRTNKVLRYPTLEVIEKLIKLELESEFHSAYPIFTKTQIESLISKTIGSDSRTINRYRECIEYFIKTNTNSNIVNYYQWNLSGLYDSCLAEKEHLSKIARDKVNEWKENCKKRIFCKDCRNYINKKGVCKCL